MRKIKILVILAIAIWLGVPNQHIDSQSSSRLTKPRIVFLSPNSPGNTYWPQVFAIFKKVASDLNFEFESYDLGVQDRFARQENALKILGSKPQAVIASVVIGHSKPILDAAEKLGVPVFILGPLFPNELAELGQKPGGTYHSWLALLNWGEAEKGYMLGKTLIQAAIDKKAYAKDGTIQVVGIGGDTSWFGSSLRQAGLERAVKEQPKARLLQVVPTLWTPKEAQSITTKLLERYPDLSVVWAASDQLAYGAALALRESGRQAGKKSFTGGLDLSDFGLAQVKAGNFVASSASLMLSYSQVAVIAYDYTQGQDFRGQYGTVLEFPTYIADRQNVEQFLELSAALPKLDFRMFSKVYNKKLGHYDFSIGAFQTALRLQPAAQP